MMDKQKDDPGSESLEDMLNHMQGKKSRSRLDYSKFAPIGWQRLTDEQRKELQEMINRFLEINYSKK